MSGSPVSPEREVFRAYLRSLAGLQILLALVLLAIVLLVVFGGVLAEHQARTRGRVALGVVRSLEETSFLGFVPRVRASIEVPEGGPRREVSMTRKDAEAYRAGGAIAVYVHPTRPEIVVPTRAENAPLYAGLCFGLFVVLWGLLLISLRSEARRYVDLFRRGERVEGAVRMLTRYQGFPLWQLEYEVDGRLLRRSCILPPGMSGEGPCVVAYDPKKPKNAVGLGPA